MITASQQIPLPKFERAQAAVNSLWCFCIVVPPVGTIGSQVVLHTSSSFSITVRQKIVGVAPSCFPVQTKVGLLGNMVVILLEHGHLTERLFNVIALNCSLLRQPATCNENIVGENKSAFSPMATD